MTMKPTSTKHIKKERKMIIEEIIGTLINMDLKKLEKEVKINNKIYEVTAYKMNDPGDTIRIDVKPIFPKDMKVG